MKAVRYAVSPEQLRRSLARMLGDQSKVRMGLTGGQQRALRRKQLAKAWDEGWNACNHYRATSEDPGNPYEREDACRDFRTPAPKSAVS